MITRIEIDGFKSFMDFSLDLPPFLAIVGRNTSGKSNLLDALTFVAAVGRGEPLADAVEAARGDAASLFHRRSDGSPVEQMTFALEFLLDGDEDGHAPVTATRWRYECMLGWRSKGRGSGRVLAVLRERFVPLTDETDNWPARFPMGDTWRDLRVRYAARADFDVRLPVPAAFEASRLIRDGSHVEAHFTDDREPRVQRFDIGSDAVWAAMSCARELAGISVLRLEPQDIAPASRLGVNVRMTGTGARLAGWLQSLVETTASEDNPSGVLRDVNMGLGRVIRDVIDVRLVLDKDRGDVRLRYNLRNDRELEAPQASDGTLRVTAMLAALHDPSRRGLLAIEEPENGVFPERFGDLMNIIRTSATDMEHDEPDWPLQQTLVTSHSPLLLDAVPRESVVFLETVSRVENGTVSRVTLPRRLLAHGERPVRREDEIPPMSETELKEFRSPIAGPT